MSMKKLADVLSGESSAATLAAAVKAGRVFAAFQDIIGPKMAAHWRPAKLEGGRLLVACSGPAFKHELARWEPQILVELQKRVPQVPISSLSGFVSGSPGSEENPSRGAARQGAVIREVHTRLAERVAGSVEDPALRRQLASVLAAALALREVDQN